MPGTTTDVKNTILISENAGQVEHCFCNEEQAKCILLQAKELNSAGSMFTCDIDAELVFSVSPDLRDRVDAAKTKLRRDIAIRDALTRNGVSEALDLRISIQKSILELQQTILQPIC